MAKQVKYTGIGKLSFVPMALKNYPNGVSLPSEDNILTVEENEIKSILLKKNGNKPLFELINKRIKKEEITEDGGEE